jgi:uncharacterized membrane-anchored protein YhcB (DUF1043 family)
MQAWVLFVVVGVFAVGMVWGFIIGRSKNSQQQRTQELESELVDMRTQMSEYKQQVSKHFTDTADVVNAMTANYRALYDQLITGAQDLCGDQIARNKLDPSAARFIEHRRDEPGASGPGGAAPGGEGLGKAAAGAAAAATAKPAAGETAAEAKPSDSREAPSHIAAAMEKSDRQQQADSDGEEREDIATESQVKPDTGTTKVAAPPTPVAPETTDEQEAAAANGESKTPAAAAGDTDKADQSAGSDDTEDKEKVEATEGKDIKKTTLGESPTIH